MKLKKVILNFVMFLAIALIGTGAMECNVKASSARSVYAALKKEKGLADAKQWMVVKEDKHNYVVLASQVKAEQFKKDKNNIHVKTINVDPQDENPWLLEDAYIKAANSVQIYNSLREVAKVIK